MSKTEEYIDYLKRIGYSKTEEYIDYLKKIGYLDDYIPPFNTVKENTLIARNFDDLIHFYALTCLNRYLRTTSSRDSTWARQNPSKWICNCEDDAKKALLKNIYSIDRMIKVVCNDYRVDWDSVINSYEKWIKNQLLNIPKYQIYC